MDQVLWYPVREMPIAAILTALESTHLAAFPILCQCGWEGFTTDFPALLPPLLEESIPQKL
jgi:hypothetical protein